MNRARLSWLASWPQTVKSSSEAPLDANQNETNAAESKKRPDVPETPFPSEEPEWSPSPPEPTPTITPKRTKSNDVVHISNTLDPLVTPIPTRSRSRKKK